MVREGYGTSGEGNGTVVGLHKMGAGEVLPLLARDPNYSSVPGSDVEPRLSDAGSGNDGPKKAARGRASLHGEVLIANKTLKKKPYKSLGWSLIAVRALANPPLSCGFSSDTDVTARTQHSGFEPPDRSETPTFFVEPRRCRARRPRAAARTSRARASPPLGGELPIDVSSSRRVTRPRFRPDPPRARLTAPPFPRARLGPPS